MSKKRQSLAEFKRQNPEHEAKAKRSEQELAKQQSNIYGVLFVVGILLVAGLAIYFYLNREEPLPTVEIPANLDLDSIPDNSQAFANQGNQHAPATEPYNSNPPTSGNHSERWITPLGVYNRQMPDEMAIHNLEHGHIWFSYRDANDTEALDLLTALQAKYADRVIVTHRPNNPTRVAAAAWTRLLSLDELDVQQLEAFIIRHSDNAPESVMGR